MKNREQFVNEKRNLKNKRKGENVIEVFLKVVKANRKSTKEHLWSI